MQALLAESDSRSSAALSRILRESGFTVHVARDGAIALEVLSENRYDLIISDVSLPKIDGLTLIERFRKENTFTHVIFISEKNDLEARVRGLEAGADDYLAKPVAVPELVARIRAVLRKRCPQAAEQAQAAVLARSGITLDLIRRQVSSGCKKVELQQKELRLLELFMRNPRQILSKARILEEIWGYRFDPQTNIVDVLIFRLREKLDPLAGNNIIKNLRGRGYVFGGDP